MNLVSTKKKRKTAIGPDQVGVIHYKDIVSYSKNMFVDSRFVLYNIFYSDKYFVREYDLWIWQRLFIMADEPRSCKFALIWNSIIIVTTFTSCMIYLLGSLQQFKVAPDTCALPACSYDATLCPNSIMCEPESPKHFEAIETVCVITLSIDYFLRVLTSGTVPSRVAGLIFDDFTEEELNELLTKFNENPQIEDFDRQYKWFFQILLYMLKPLNIIDLIAILPYYLSLNKYTITKRNNLTVLRIFRLGRVFRVIKIVKNTVGVQLIMRTLLRAIDALGILVFLSGIAVVVYGSLMDYIEEGEYTVDSIVPHGGYVRSDLLGEEVESPFLSIPLGLYYSVVTICTVGYGDMYPTTPGGRFFACSCMYCGVLIFALPISVLGHNFDRLCDETRGGSAELVAAAFSELVDGDLIDDNLRSKILDEYDEMKHECTYHEYVARSLAHQEVNVLSQLAKHQARKLSALAIISKGLMDANSANTKKLNIYLEEIGLEYIIDAIEDPTFLWQDNARYLFFPENFMDDKRVADNLSSRALVPHGAAIEIDHRVHRETVGTMLRLYESVKPKISKKEKEIKKSVKVKRNSIGLNAFGRLTSDDEEISSDMLAPNEKYVKQRSQV